MWARGVLLLAALCVGVLGDVQWRKPNYLPHPLGKYSDADVVTKVAKMVDLKLFKQHLKPILMPRPVGSENHGKVQKFLIEHFTNLGWHIMEDAFEDHTPKRGQMITRQFRNIVATLNPYAPRRLVLAAHYDSKLFDDFDFVGATDSAVPCAMMVHMATILDPYLQNRNAMKDVTLQFIFFDGEEAFEDWTHTDSIYGARHLAQAFETNRVLKPGSLGGMGGDHSSADRDRRDADDNEGMPSLLQAMDVMVLLDLLGAANPRLYALQQPTEALHQRLHEIERNLGLLGLLENYRTWSGYFQPLKPRTNYAIEDDHLPFLHRNVPIVHVIATPFPSVWHKESDNANAIDYPTTMNLLKVFTVFVCEYMHLDIPYP